MSLKTEPPKGYAGPPPPTYTYPPQMETNRIPPPSLPPMSSLLRYDDGEAEAQSSSFTARQYQPPYSSTTHPLWLAQHDANAPVPQESMLVALQPQQSLTGPSNHSAPQRRTAKKIVQRTRDDIKEQSLRRKSSTEPPIRFNAEGRDPSVAAQSYMRPNSPPKAPSPRQMAQSRSMPISGLLSDGPSPVRDRSQPEYTLKMRQEPIAARACGFGERDRRVIDPPPILQMHVDDPNSSPEQIRALIRQPYSVVHCVLWDPVSDSDDTAMPGTTDKRQQRRLMGTLVASPFVGNDEHGIEGCFFTFPDLSVRTPGTYKLKFSLVKLDPSRMQPGNREPIKSIVFSSVFHVYNAKEFQGMRASTELTKTLKHQGCLISVKKGNNKANGSRQREDDDDDDDDEEDDDEGDRKRGKRPRR